VDAAAEQSNTIATSWAVDAVTCGLVSDLTTETECANATKTHYDGGEEYDPGGTLAVDPLIPETEPVDCTYNNTPCTTDAQCTAPEVCDIPNNVCITDQSLNPGGGNTACTDNTDCTAPDICNNRVCGPDPNADKTGFKLTGRNGGSIKKNVFYTDYYCSESTPGDSDYIECDANKTPNTNNFDKLFAWVFDVSDSLAKHECCS